MSRKSKSKRFTQQASDSVKKHDERFPYRARLGELEGRKADNEDTVGGL
ncbi:competence protein [Radiobacillus sp. PE A8.2]